jgi:hypothetical protein
MKIGMFDLENGQIERNATAEEKTLREEDIAKFKAAIKTKEAEAEAKATARAAIADRLGLTADELKLLLG